MKTFIISFIICFGAIELHSLPTLMDQPGQLTLRIAMYLAFPASVALSIVFIVVSHALGFGQVSETSSQRRYGLEPGANLAN